MALFLLMLVELRCFCPLVRCSWSFSLALSLAMCLLLLWGRDRWCWLPNELCAAVWCMAVLNCSYRCSRLNCAAVVWCVVLVGMTASIHM